MQIIVQISSSMYSGGIAAEREAVRLACLGWCLGKYSRVAIGRNIASGWWSGFQTEDLVKAHALVLCSDRLTERPKGAGVVIGQKATVENDRDLQVIEYVDYLVAHEYDPRLEGHPKLVPIPFPVNHRVMKYFRDEGLLESYLRDDVEVIHAQHSVQRRAGVGFVGVGYYGRKLMAGRLPSWCHCEFNDSPQLSARRYLQRLASWKAGIHFPGDTPKSNRHMELVLLGTPVVTVPVEPQVDPPITSENTILLKDWSDRSTLMAGLGSRVAEQATLDYCEGWSIMSTARKLIGKIKCTG